MFLKKLMNMKTKGRYLEESEFFTSNVKKPPS
jgi:hypothetical protein